MKCTRCDLYTQSRVNCLSGSGPKSAKIVFVGEAPGALDSLRREPFVGELGQILNRLLKGAGIEREEVRLETIVRCRPRGDVSPTDEQVEACREHLVSLLDEMSPTVIVPLGNAALYGILGLKNIMKNVGQIFLSTRFNCKVIPVFRPAYILRNPGFESLGVEYFKKIKRESLTRAIVRARGRYALATSVEKVRKVFAKLEKVKEVTIDLETTSRDFITGKILCVGFSWERGTGVVVPLLGQKQKILWNSEEYEEIIAGLKKFFNSSSFKIGQNAGFDIKFLRKYGIEGKGFDFDTMLAHHLLDENAVGFHGLKDFAVLYTDMGAYEKGIEKYLPNKNVSYDAIPLEVLGKYCAKDVDCTFRCYEVFKPCLEKEGLWPLFSKIVMPLQEVLTDVEYRGVLVDLRQFDVLEKRYGRELSEIETKVREFSEVRILEEELNKGKKSPKPFNLNSPTQIRKLLVDKLHLRIEKKTAKGFISTDVEVLEGLQKQHEIPSLLLQHRKISKLRSTYVKGMRKLVDDTGRIHTEYKIHGTRTGRLSSSRPNLQNIPKKTSDVKNLFIARENYILVESDFKQMEYRIWANYCRDQKMLDDINAGKDTHRESAALAFGIPIEEVTEEQRFIAKRVTFGIMYGRGAVSIAQEFGIEKEEAQRIIDSFLNRYPKANKWLKDTKKRARREKQVRNLFGRIRRLPWIDYGELDRKDLAGEAFRQSVNSPIQGGASDVTAIAAIRIFRRLKKEPLNMYLYLTVHDSLVYEVKESQLDAAVALIQEEMTRPIKGIVVPLEIDIKVGKRWGDMKPFIVEE